MNTNPTPTAMWEAFNTYSEAVDDYAKQVRELPESAFPRLEWELALSVVLAKRERMVEACKAFDALAFGERPWQIERRKSPRFALAIEAERLRRGNR